MKKENAKLNRPDVSLANRIKAIFVDDPQINIEFKIATEDTISKLIISVSNSQKASAIRKILPERYNISLPLKVEVKDTSDMDGNIIRAAFEGNPHFKDYVEITDPLTLETYHICIFKEEVIKFQNDNASSLHGYEFRLMEDLTKEILDVPKLLITTDDGIPYTSSLADFMLKNRK